MSAVQMFARAIALAAAFLTIAALAALARDGAAPARAAAPACCIYMIF